jgi:hypothetical protein
MREETEQRRRSPRETELLHTHGRATGMGIRTRVSVFWPDFCLQILKKKEVSFFYKAACKLLLGWVVNQTVLPLDWANLVRRYKKKIGSIGPLIFYGCLGRVFRRHRPHFPISLSLLSLCLVAKMLAVYLLCSSKVFKNY